MVTVFLSYSIIPLFAALALPFLARNRKTMAEILVNVALFTGFANITYILFKYLIANNYSNFTLDGFTLIMIFTIYLVGFAITFFSTYYDIDSETNPITYYALILVSVSAMCSLVMARDFFTLYIFLEALSITSFALITSTDKKISVEASIKYFFLTFPASVLIILGISLLLLNYGDLNFSVINFTQINTLTVIALSLIFTGFIIKSGITPFHFWTPDVYEGAFSPISAYLAGIVTKIGGIYAIIKISILIMHSDLPSKLSSFLLFTGTLSIIVGAIGALYQKDIKRMLAYSSISQMGYILVATGTFSPLGIIAAVFHLINHATFKTVLFLNSASIEKNLNTTDITKLKGLEHRMPWTSWTSIISLFSTAGLPPLSGFWSKFLIIVSLFITGHITYGWIALIFSVVTLAYFMILQKNVFFGKLPSAFETVKEVRTPLLIPVVFISAIIIIAGIYFPHVFNYLDKTIFERLI